MSRGVLSSSLEYFLTYVLGEKEQKVAKLMRFFFQTDEKKGGSDGIVKSYFWLIIKKYLDMKGNYYC